MISESPETNIADKFGTAKANIDYIQDLPNAAKKI